MTVQHLRQARDMAATRTPLGLSPGVLLWSGAALMVAIAILSFSRFSIDAGAAGDPE